MTMSGMNVESIRTVAARLDTLGTSVAQIARDVDGLVHLASSNWRGNDLRQFEGQWRDAHRATCLRLGEELRALADTARRNAEHQQATSGTLEGDAGGSAGGLPLDGSLRTMPSYLHDNPGGLLGEGSPGRTLYDLGLGWLDQLHTLDQLRDTTWRGLGDARTGSPLFSTLLYLPQALDAFSQAATGDLSWKGGLGFTGKTFEVGGLLLEHYAGSLDGLALSKSLSATGGALQGAVDFGRAYESFQQGDPWATAYHVAHGGTSAVGGVVPQVALCLAAWDLGVTTGTAIAESPPMQQHLDGLVAYGAAHDEDIATRYDIGKRGVEAVGNFINDGVKSLFR